DSVHRRGPGHPPFLDGYLAFVCFRYSACHWPHHDCDGLHPLRMPEGDPPYTVLPYVKHLVRAFKGFSTPLKDIQKKPKSLARFNSKTAREGERLQNDCANYFGDLLICFCLDASKRRSARKRLHIMV